MFDKLKKLIKKEEYPNTPYSQMGGKETIDQLVDRFYYHMDTDPNAKRCRDLHAKSLESANEKLREFLYGWLGGPQIYIEKYGHPRMRKRHFPFKITEVERDEWLLCMRNALNDIKLEPQLDDSLWQGFRRFAEHMRNH